MKALITGFLFLLLLIAPLSAQWVQTSGPAGVIVISAAVQNDNLIFINQGGDLYKRSGASWERFASIYGSGRLQVVDDVLFIIKSEQLYRSSDAGATWVRMPVKGTITSGAGKFYNVTNDSLFTSNDQGASWQFIDTLSLFTQFVVPQGQYLIAGVNGWEQRLLRSSDGGINWSEPASAPVPLALNTFVSSVITDGGVLYALLSNGEIYRSDDNGDVWVKALEAPTIDQIQYQALIKQGNTFWVQSSSGIYFWDGTQWKLRYSGYTNLVSATAEEAIISSTEGITRISAVDNTPQVLTDGFVNSGIYALSEIGGVLLASAHNGVHRSADYGATWQKVNDLKPYYFVGKGSHIYAGAYEGLIHSTDAGQTWSHFATPRDESWQDVSSIAVNDDGIYVAYGKTFGEHGQSNWVSGGVLFSDDGGNTWRNRNSGIPANVETHAPVYQIVNFQDELFIATIEGFFRSQNGTFWTPMNAGIEFSTNFKGGTYITGGNKLYVHRAFDLYELTGSVWTKLPPLDSSLTIMGAYGGYISAVGDSLFVIAYKYDPSTTTSEYYTFVFNGTAWQDITSSLPLKVVLNSYIRTNGMMIAGSLNDGVWKSGTPLSVRSEPQNVLQLSPNPVRDKLTLHMPDGTYQLTLTDQLGRSTRMHVASREPVDVSFIPAGSYHVSVTNASGQTVHAKLLKE